ncbi:serine protease 27-like isoform X1, partial [Gallus gallus]|uniref:serine protease 27-like isoform X1 n=1 Tax=Gallus gallus TaxID=9031 RepID=UPI001AE1E374
MGAPQISFVLLLIFSPTAAPLPHCDGDGREDGVRTVKASELTREQQMCGRPMAVGSRRNVGGEDAVEGQWPWQGSLLRDGTHICGVSLVAPQWVLTAAHCFQRSLDPRLYAVLLGVQELSGPWGQNRTVPLDRLLPHPAYAGEATSGDIALAQLAWPVTYGATIAPVCLPGPKLNFPAGTQCVATGWGDIGEGEDLPSPRRLQEVAVPLMAQAQCRRLYGTEMGAGRPPRRVRDDMICAGYPQGLRDTCKGYDLRQVSAGAARHLQ